MLTVIEWLGGLVATETAMVAVLLVLWLRARRRGAALLRQLESGTRRRTTSRLVPVGREAVKTMMQTASLIRDKGMAGALRSSVEELAGWARVERPDLVRLAAEDGTVTIAFSDIEDSTALNETLGDRAWVRLLGRHERLVHRAVEAHGGQVVKAQGDGFMLAFGSASHAVACGVQVQRSLARQHKPTVRMRLGIHRGEVVHRDGDLFGRNVAFAARVAGQACGGEILVSDAPREALDSSVVLDEGRDAELKGVAGTHRVYAVQWAA